MPRHDEDGDDDDVWVWVWASVGKNTTTPTANTAESWNDSWTVQHQEWQLASLSDGTWMDMHCIARKV